MMLGGFWRSSRGTVWSRCEGGDSGFQRATWALETGMNGYFCYSRREKHGGAGRGAQRGCRSKCGPSPKF